MNHKQQQHLIGECNLVENEFRRLTSFSSPRLSPTSTERKPRLDPLRPFEMAARCLKTQQDKARQAIAQRVGPGLVSVDEPPVIEQGIDKPEVYQSIDDMMDMFVWSTEYVQSGQTIKEDEAPLLEITALSRRSSRDNKTKKKKNKKRSEEKRKEKGKKKKREARSIKKKETNECEQSVCSFADTVVASNKASVN